MSLSRRSFIGGSVAAAAATVVGARPALARIPLRREKHRVVIVGSGFGGGVSALRLAQAGVTDIVVLERGKRWPTGPNASTFPDIPHMDQRALWYDTAPRTSVLPGLVHQSVIPYAGLIEAHVNPNLSVLNAAGVGGGSLVYQGMTLQPSRAVFEETFPHALDYDRLDKIHYPRVAKMLQVQVAPDSLINTKQYYAPRVFKKRALAAGYSVEKIPMPIDWNYALKEIRGEVKPSYTNGNGFFGVNNGGKHSIDVTYIAQAEATGRATVRPLHNVTGVAQTPKGRWEISVNHTDVHGKVLEQLIITTDTLILAAGCVNTNKILLRARDRGAIPGLPDGIGENWGTNGDRIVAWTAFDEDFGAVQGGPVIYGTKEWDKPKIANTIIQASVPPLGFDPRTTIMVGFGVSPVRGRWKYNSVLDDIVLSWKREGDAVLHRRIWERMTKIAGPQGFLTDTHTPVPMTWHPLGGANMGKVCDLDGRVHDNPGLYVLDGALMPGTTAACNPSMTIAAIAERAMDNIVAQEVGQTI